jgi:hypothetical protein
MRLPTAEFLGVSNEELERLNVALDPDLEPYVFVHPTLGRILHHPLLIEFTFANDPFGVARVNAIYRTKKEYVDQAKAERKWSRYLCMFERPYRITELKLSRVNLTMRDIGRW